MTRCYQIFLQPSYDVTNYIDHGNGSQVYFAFLLLRSNLIAVSAETCSRKRWKCHAVVWKWGVVVFSFDHIIVQCIARDSCVR